MFMGLITVILVDAILFLVIRLVHVEWTQKRQSVPLGYAGGLFTLCCVAHFGATKTMGRAAAGPEQAWLVAAASAAFGFVPIWAYVRMLSMRISEETRRRRADVYPRASKLRLEGDIDGALRQYLKYYERTPDRARPLFSAAGMLEQEKQYEKAATLFQQIMERFERDETVWGKAAYRLARLYEDHLDSSEAARKLRSEAERRVSSQTRARIQTGDLDASTM